MKRIVWVLIILPVLYQCKNQWASEQEETAFWNPAVIDPAYKVLYKEEKLEPALRVFDSLLSQTHRQSPYIASIRHILVANYHYFFTHDDPATGAAIDSALACFRTETSVHHYPRAYVSHLLFGGLIAYRLSDYEKANEYYFSAKRLADTYLTICERSNYAYNLAMVSYRQENFAQSAIYFKEAFESQATCPEQNRAVILQQQEIQSNIGLCQFHQGRYDSALVYYQNALQLAEKFRDSLGPKTMDMIRGVIYGNEGKVYQATGELDKAEPLFAKSVKLNARPGYELRDGVFNLLHLSELYGLQQRYDDMYGGLQKVRLHLDSLPDTEIETDWRRLMSAYYHAQGNSVRELYFFKSYVSLKDSLAADQERLVQADVTRRLDEQGQQLRIADLTKNNQINRIYLWVAVAMTLMGIIIIILINQGYRKSRRTNAALKNLNIALEQANAEKDRILHVVAHDLRNPIGLTAYVADMILMEEKNEKEKASLQMIREASGQALHLTNQLLGLRHKQGSKSFEKTDLTQVTRTAVEMLRYKASEKDINLQLHLPDPFVWVMGDATALNRLVSNLVGNAIKFTSTGGEVKVTLHVAGKEAALIVEDNGIGIPIEKQNEAFHPFTTARRQGTSGERSYGLGLSICKEITEIHGGSIELKSEEGKGTCVRIAFALAQDS